MRLDITEKEEEEREGDRRGGLCRPEPQACFTVCLVVGSELSLRVPVPVLPLRNHLCILPPTSANTSPSALEVLLLVHISMSASHWPSPSPGCPPFSPNLSLRPQSHPLWSSSLASLPPPPPSTVNQPLLPPSKSSKPTSLFFYLFRIKSILSLGS